MTKDYTVVNTETNAVLRYLTCLESDAASNCADGESIVLGYIEGTVGEEDTNALIRAIRDSLLTACDWTQVADSPLTDAKKAEWRTYRQALRNFPSTNSATSLENTTWPTAP